MGIYLHIPEQSLQMSFIKYLDGILQKKSYLLQECVIYANAQKTDKNTKKRTHIQTKNQSATTHVFMWL